MWSRVHKRHAGAILISKVLVKSEWVWQHVIDPVAPVKSYPGVISIHQICLENILRVLWLTCLPQNNNSLTHISSSALLRARIVICLTVPQTRVKTKHFPFIDFVVGHLAEGHHFHKCHEKYCIHQDSLIQVQRMKLQLHLTHFTSLSLLLAYRQVCPAGNSLSTTWILRCDAKWCRPCCPWFTLPGQLWYKTG